VAPIRRPPSWRKSACGRDVLDAQELQLLAAAAKYRDLLGVDVGLAEPAGLGWIDAGDRIAQFNK
jgi:hypothetical protein